MLTIPFQLSGVTGYFTVKKSKKAEWGDDSIMKIELVDEDPVWNPTSSEFSDKGAANMNYRGEVITREAIARGNFVIDSVGTRDAADIKDDAHFGLALENEGAVSRVGVSKSTAKPKVDYFNLSKKWGMSPDIENKALQVTNQSGIRTVLHPYLSRRFRTND